MDETKRMTIEEMMEGKQKPEMDRKSWVGFVESDAVTFMTQFDLEKVTLYDGQGNKAKLTRRKDNSIYVECTSANIL
jgi:hypothetical protein